MPIPKPTTVAGRWTTLTVLAWTVPSTPALSPAPTQTLSHCRGRVGSLTEVRVVEPTNILIDLMTVFHWAQLPALAFTASNAERIEPCQSTGPSSSGAFWGPLGYYTFTLEWKLPLLKESRIIKIAWDWILLLNWFHILWKFCIMSCVCFFVCLCVSVVCKTVD